MNNSHLSLFSLDTSKQVLWQTVKTQMKCSASGSALFAKKKRSSDTLFY